MRNKTYYRNELSQAKIDLNQVTLLLKKLNEQEPKTELMKKEIHSLSAEQARLDARVEDLMELV